MEQLPKMTNNQILGNRSASLLKEIMMKFCSFPEIEQNQDLGIDFIGTVIVNGVPTRLNFNAQCKGIDEIEKKYCETSDCYTYQIKVSTINYWIQKNDVTFLFLVDSGNDVIYWSAPLKEVKGKSLDCQTEYTFHIPRSNIIRRIDDELPELFIFEIISYSANFAPRVCEQMQRVAEGSDDGITKIYMTHIFDMMKDLEENFRIVCKKYEETAKAIRDNIQNDLCKSINACTQLDQIDDIVRTYCVNGVFEEPFDAGNGKKTIKDLENEFEALTKKDDIDYIQLSNFYKQLFEYKGNIIGYLREMIYEDDPFNEHKDIEDEFNTWLAEKGIKTK